MKRRPWFVVERVEEPPVWLQLTQKPYERLWTASPEDAGSWQSPKEAQSWAQQLAWEGTPCVVVELTEARLTATRWALGYPSAGVP